MRASFSKKIFSLFAIILLALFFLTALLPTMVNAASAPCLLSYDGGVSSYEGRWHDSDKGKACRPFNDTVKKIKRSERDFAPEPSTYKYVCSGSSDEVLWLDEDKGDSFSIDDWHDGKHWICVRQRAVVTTVPLYPSKYSEGLVPGFEGLIQKQNLRNYKNDLLDKEEVLFILGGDPRTGQFYLNDVWMTNDLKTWELVSPNDPQSTRKWDISKNFGYVTLDEKLFVLGGKVSNPGSPWYTSNDEVWVSDEGKEWELVTDAPGFWNRYHFPAVAHNGRIFVIGGIGFSDIWSSHNGRKWDYMSVSPWGYRWDMEAESFHDKIYVFGGHALNSRGQTVYPTDVWSSPDGIQWTEEKTTSSGALGLVSLPMGGREGFEISVFKNKLWYTGGWSPSAGNHNDVWSSVDGVNWVKEVEHAPWPARSAHTMVVFQDKLVILGGITPFSPGTYHDVWSSVDGINWVQEPDAPWPGRYYHGALVGKKNKIVPIMSDPQGIQPSSSSLVP